MGEVHLANDTRLGRKIAIKVLHLSAALRDASRERFHTEAKAISSLNHPHICALYDVGEQDGRAYLVMERGWKAKPSPAASSVGSYHRIRCCATQSRLPRRSIMRIGMASCTAT